MNMHQFTNFQKRATTYEETLDQQEQSITYERTRQTFQVLNQAQRLQKNSKHCSV